MKAPNWLTRWLGITELERDSERNYTQDCARQGRAIGELTELEERLAKLEQRFTPPAEKPITWTGTKQTSKKKKNKGVKK
jgi:hypothetical protein